MGIGMGIGNGVVAIQVAMVKTYDICGLWGRVSLL